MQCINQDPPISSTFNCGVLGSRYKTYQRQKKSNDRGQRLADILKDNDLPNTTQKFNHALKTVQSFSVEDQKRFVEALNLSKNAFPTATQTAPTPQEKPDLSIIPLWKGKKIDGSSIAYLEDHFGDFLATFRAEKNLIYRQDIIDHDPKLVASIDQEAYKLGRKSREFIPTRTNKINEIAHSKNIDPEIIRVASALNNRLSRGQSLEHTSI